MTFGASADKVHVWMSTESVEPLKVYELTPSLRTAPAAAPLISSELKLLLVARAPSEIAPACTPVAVAGVQVIVGAVTSTVNERASLSTLTLPAASVPVTVCAPAAVAVQAFPVQEPLGVIEKVVFDVTSPSELFAASKPCAVYVRVPPAAIVALEGLITM